MSKRGKRIITILIVLAVLYLLLTGGSYYYLRTFIFPSFEQSGYRVTGAYPYSEAAVPDDFTEYTIAGLKLQAPDCLDAEAEQAEYASYLSHDASEYDLQIKAYEMQSDYGFLKEKKTLSSKWITGCGWLMKLGMKKIGCGIPESNNEMLYLLEKLDPRDYNKFSLIEAYAITKLSVLKAVFIPARIGHEKYDSAHPLEVPLEVEECSYYLEKDSFHAIIRQGRSDGGRYRLTIVYYPDSDLETIKWLLVQSDDPVLAQTIAASVRQAETPLTE